MLWQGRRTSSNVEDRRGMSGGKLAVGDDHIQKQMQGYVVPDAFTHGTSKQRLKWFMKGFKTGDMSQGDTFGAKNL
jgi:predicted metalloprotease